MGDYQDWAGVLSTLFIVAVLAILEVFLSFDNAVVNAVVLKKMNPVWRWRFITWGIAIAVFGMRIVFLLFIVAIITRIDSTSALVMAATDPDRYSRVLTSAHISLSAFGGAFLAMVGLKTLLQWTCTGSVSSSVRLRALDASRRWNLEWSCSYFIWFPIGFWVANSLNF